MSLGPLMVDLAGAEITPKEKEILAHPLVGGVILFSRNFESPEQLIALTEQIHKIRTPRLLISVDHEGGRVQRFKKGFTLLPPMRLLGSAYDKNKPHAKNEAKKMAQTIGWLMSVELLSVGVDFSFTPVLDIDKGISNVIGDRAFHTDPEIIADLTHSFMIGMKNAGMAATGKHFPGHGHVEADSHVAIPIDERAYQDIYSEDIVPFERMIHFGLAAIMPAHVIYPQIDDKPAGFSPIWINQILRQQLSFDGIVFSDDLSMEGASAVGGFVERAEAALDAGCDMVLVCNSPDAVITVIDGLKQQPNPVSQARLIRMHGKISRDLDHLQQKLDWTNAVRALDKFVDKSSMDLDL
ncbi:MAG: beta-N-acetylhexosaminidase [Gammaproteobacteria bacterium]|nr:beta-N-acetylhexosaminidase [Gammaproteobacteria bacterium]